MLCASASRLFLASSRILFSSFRLSSSFSFLLKPELGVDPPGFMKRLAYTFASRKSKSALFAVAAGFRAPPTPRARLSAFGVGFTGIPVGVEVPVDGLFFFIGGSFGFLGGGGAAASTLSAFDVESSSSPSSLRTPRLPGKDGPLLEDTPLRSSLIAIGLSTAAALTDLLFVFEKVARLEV
ncbi:uncharacterized protein PHACADRAFT_256168, partial [Phanerochaete carnosa HHB-10118-sp]